MTLRLQGRWEELLAMIDSARFLAVNDYEGRMLSERTGLSLADLAKRVEAMIVTSPGSPSGSDTMLRSPNPVT